MLDAAAAAEALPVELATVTGWLALEAELDELAEELDEAALEALEFEFELEVEELADELAWANTALTKAKDTKTAEQMAIIFFIMPYYIPFLKFVNISA